MAVADSAPESLEPLREALDGFGIDPDHDYTDAFQHYAHCSTLVETGGATKQELLTRGHTAFEIGDYHRALMDAVHAQARDESDAQPLLLRGQALLALAAVRTGLIAPGPGMATQVVPSLRDLLAQAHDAIGHALHLAPDDAKLRRVHAATQRLVGLPLAA